MMMRLVRFLIGNITEPHPRQELRLVIGCAMLLVVFFGPSNPFAIGKPIQDDPVGESQSVSLQSDSPPDWFHVGDRSSGKSDFLFVSTEGQPNQSLAEAALINQLREQIVERLGSWFGNGTYTFSQLNSNFIRQQLIVADHFSIVPYEDELTRAAAEELGNSPGPYFRGYAEIELTPEFRQLADRWRHQPSLEQRLKLIGLGSGTLLASLAILFGYLKLDHATRSHYSRRLQLVALAAFFAVAVAAVAAISTII